VPSGTSFIQQVDTNKSPLNTSNMILFSDLDSKKYVQVVVSSFVEKFNNGKFEWEGGGGIWKETSLARF
jgi:hypothetical protein